MPIIDIPLSGKNMKVAITHTILFVAMVVGLSVLSDSFDRTPSFVWTVSGLVISIVLLLSGLDYADVLRFRKSVDRLTRCAVCGESYRQEGMLEVSKNTIDVEIEGGKNQSKTVAKEILEKERFLNGLICHDKLVCESCLSVIDKLRNK